MSFRRVKSRSKFTLEASSVNLCMDEVVVEYKSLEDV